MATIELRTKIKASRKLCFDLARDVDLHVESNSKSRERAVAGKTTGLVELGDTITWKARHFGIWFKMTVKIVAFESPNSFTDTMVKGPFRSMQHVHSFEESNGSTTMVDKFSFQSPFGLIGRFVDAVFLKRYMTKFLVKKNEVLKVRAEELKN